MAFFIEEDQAISDARTAVVALGIYLHCTLALITMVICLDSQLIFLVAVARFAS